MTWRASTGLRSNRFVLRVLATVWRLLLVYRNIGLSVEVKIPTMWTSGGKCGDKWGMMWITWLAQRQTH